MDAKTIVQILWYANTAAILILLIRLVYARLAPVYRWFWWYLLAVFLEQVVRIVLQSRPRASAYAYSTSHSVEVLMSVFLVTELYRLGLASHPAIARYGRRAAGYLLGAAGVIAGAGLLLLPILGPVRPGRSPAMYYFYAFERTMDSAVLLFLLLAVAFMLWFPLRISQNVAVFIGGFVTYFVSRWAFLLTLGMRPALVNDLNAAAMSLSLLCFVGWIALLRPEGESVSTVTGHRWNPEEMERLSRQLTAINARLERFSEKSEYISLQS